MADDFRELKRQTSRSSKQSSIETHIQAYSTEVEECQDKEKIVKEGKTITYRGLTHSRSASMYNSSTLKNKSLVSDSWRPTRLLCPWR